MLFSTLTPMRALISLASVGLVIQLTGVARAQVAAGQPFPAARVEDLDGTRVRTLPSEPGRPPAAMVLLWEDDRSSKQKQAAHAVVGRYSDNPENRAAFELVAVADLERWDFWPAKKHARASIKKTQKDSSTAVWLDWKGELRRALRLRKAETAFVVVGADGRIRFAAQGQLDEAQRRALDDAIAGLGGKPLPGR
jgi:hypothetical protein